MVITSESFENPPPKSLDPQAAERVRKSISKRKRNQSVAPLPEETVSSQERPEVIEAAKRSQSVERPEVIEQTQRRTITQRAKSFIETQRNRREETVTKLRGKLEEAQEKSFQKSIKADTRAERIKAQATGAAAGFASAAVETTVALQPRNIIETGRKLTTREGRREISESLAQIGPRARQPGREGETFGKLAFEASVGAAPKVLNVLDVTISPKGQFPRRGTVKVNTPAKETIVELKGGTASTAEPLKVQVERAGTRVDAVSTGRDFFKTREPGEIVTIAKETPAGTPDIEKAFFATPKPQARQSRLGLPGPIEETAAAEISFTTDKSRQILVFQDTPVSDFPSNLQPTISKIRRGKTPTPQEAQQLIEFQTRSEGTSFKAPGKLTVESEVTLPEGAGVRSEGLVSTTLIKGERVEIFSASVASPEEVAAYRAITGTQPPARSFGRSREARVEVTPSDVITRTPLREAPEPTTRSLTGLEVRNSNIPSRTRTSGPVTSDLSRGFVPPSTPERRVAPSRERPRVNIPITPRTTVGNGFRARTPTPQRITPSIPITPRISRPTTPARATPRTTTTLTRPFVARPRLQRREGERGGFTIQVFRKGKFVTVGRRETKQRAIGLGARTVGSSELRSFRVLQRGKPLTAEENKVFRKKKRDSFTFVERSRFAINTPGEVSAIPGASQRRRKKR